MSRQIYQKSGPIGIIGLTREPTAIENYYNEYYYTFTNQTYYGDNETEPDYTQPLST